MLIDDITIRIAAGHGGKGAAVFNKTLMTLGPAGGSGGRGGNVVAVGVSDLGALRQFRYKKEFAAEDGREGRGQLRDGHIGADLVLKLPVGTVIHRLGHGVMGHGAWEEKEGKKEHTNDTDETSIEIARIGETIVLAKGGLGGKGNFQFRSATNTSPKQFQSGLPGESFEVRLELKLIADVGFVGLPNAGKSSMLNELTKAAGTSAASKVANYPFTTLEPNLGAYYELILADIPGLIEGSSTGRGLGIKFLRHVERTRILFHFVSAESPDPARDYKTIRGELGAYNKDLLRKKEYLFLSKSDLLDKKEMKTRLAILKKLNPKVAAISVLDPASQERIKKILNQIQQEKMGAASDLPSS